LVRKVGAAFGDGPFDRYKPHSTGTNPIIPGINPMILA
jgi:hypothetical protein